MLLINRNRNNIMSDLSCSVCFGSLLDDAPSRPVSTQCGHFYHEMCLVESLDRDRVRSACPLCNTFVRDSFYIFPSIDDEYFQPFLRSLLQSFQYLQNFTEGEAIVGNQEIRPILANMRLNEQFNNQFGREIDSLINRIQSIHSNCAVLKDNLRYYNEILSETMGLILKQNRKLIAMKTKQRKGKKINKKDRLCVRKGTRLRNSWLITNREE